MALVVSDFAYLWYSSVVSGYCIQYSWRTIWTLRCARAVTSEFVVIYTMYTGSSRLTNSNRANKIIIKILQQKINLGHSKPAVMSGLNQSLLIVLVSLLQTQDMFFWLCTQGSQPNFASNLKEIKQIDLSLFCLKSSENLFR